MKLLVLQSDNSTVTPLPDNVSVLLALPVTTINTLLEGGMVDGKFVAKVDGQFRINVSSKAQLVDNYQVRIWHERTNDIHVGDGESSNAARRISVSRDVTLSLKAGDVVSIYDLQIGSSDATRWEYSDAVRVEISFLG